MSIEHTVSELSRARQEYALLKAGYEDLYAKFLRENNDLLNALSARGEKVSGLEEDVRNIAMTKFAQDGNKHPCEGVSIRDYSVAVYDEALAFAWAKSRGQAVKFDKTAFERIAKADPANMPEWCSVRKVPRAIISSDL